MKKPLLVNLLLSDGSRFVVNHRGAFAVVPATNRSREEAAATLAYLTLAGDRGAVARMSIQTAWLIRQVKQHIENAQREAVRTVERRSFPSSWDAEEKIDPALTTLYRIAFTKRVTRETYRRYGQSQEGKGLGRV